MLPHPQMPQFGSQDREKPPWGCNLREDGVVAVEGFYAVIILAADREEHLKILGTCARGTLIVHGSLAHLPFTLQVSPKANSGITKA